MVREKLKGRTDKAESCRESVITVEKRGNLYHVKDNLLKGIKNIG